jgi:hypothetical protein
MQILDVGIPAWQIALPGGGILRMSSCQGVMIIDDPEPDKDDEIARLQAALDEAHRTIRSISGGLTAQYPIIDVEDDEPLGPGPEAHQ